MPEPHVTTPTPTPTPMSDLPSFFACPTCRSPLTSLATCGQGHEFARCGSVVNFLAAPGEWDAPTEGTSDTEVEHAGMLRRVDSFIVPWIEGATGRLEGVRLLENGCGVGSTVLALLVRGVDAWGIDPGWRHSHWSEEGRGRLHVADGTKLPFCDESFDLVTSSGVLEHVGYGEGRLFLPEAQAAYIAESLRVLKPGGKALIAHPNGAHPLDYWHPRRFSIRPHVPYERWMPVASRVRRWAEEAPYPVRVEFLAPKGYLAFERIKQHGYGRRLAPLVKAFVNSLERWPRLVTTPLNPFLVTQLTRTG
jgi:SAM-dependent methyltransferase